MPTPVGGEMMARRPVRYDGGRKLSPTKAATLIVEGQGDSQQGCDAELLR